MKITCIYSPSSINTTLQKQKTWQGKASLFCQTHNLQALKRKLECKQSTILIYCLTNWGIRMTLLTCDADRRIDIHVQYITKCTPHYFLHV